MLKDLVIVVAGSTVDAADARVLASEIERQGLRAWFLEDSTKVGDSRLEAIDNAVQEAGAMILVRTGGADYEPWSAIQQKAFQIKNRFGDEFGIFVLPKGPTILEPTLLARSVLLPQDLEPKSVAAICARFIKGGPPESPSGNAIGAHGAPLLGSGIWTQANAFAHTYPAYAEIVLNMAALNEYEAANAFYWKILYFSGYREHWDRRLQLTELLIDLSKRNRDDLNVGMLLLKGLSYAFIERKQPHLAFHAIHLAHRIFQKCGNRRGQALCWDYVGEVYSSLGEQTKAVRAYDRAIQGLRGLARDHVILRKRFLLASNADLHAKQRETELKVLQREFASVCNFRKGLASIELARGLVARGGFQEAENEAQEAASFFRDTAGMPRYLAKAEVVLAQIRAGNTGSINDLIAKDGI
jgi:tetratricopeptide (TPR) repeat protein